MRILAVIALLAMAGCSSSHKAGAGVSTNPANSDASPSGPTLTCSTTPYAPVYNDALYDYSKIYMDVDEWRDMPVRYRYVHGGFTGTDLKFSIYFPPKEQYAGRFFHYILPVSGNEHAIENPEYPDPSYTVGFAADSGAYLVESNMGTGSFLPTSDPNITLYRGSAAAAEASRVIANQMYCPHRPYGYAWGGSGGAFKTIACIESTNGVWDGVVPFIHGTPVSLPLNFTVQANAMRMLKGAMPGIVDATEPGGSGDMYAGLNDVQRAALLEVTKFGFPPRCWFNYKNIAFGYTGVLGSLLDSIVSADSSYFTNDFWNLPGYLGHDHPELVQPDRITNYQTSITQVLTGDDCRAMGIPLSLSATQPENASNPAAFVMDSLPNGDLRGATITLKSGGASAATAYVAGVFGNVLAIGYGLGGLALAKVAPADQVTIDNSVYLAVQTYHRHQTPSRDYYVYDQYRNPDGTPIYPQRPVQVTSLFNQAGDMSGRFDAKMIVVINLMDEIALPWAGDWYRSRVKAAQGSKFDDVYRLWYVDYAMHTPPIVNPGDPPPVLTTNILNYGPVLQQALRDLAAWVEQGVAPPASSEYQVMDGQVQLPATADERKGVQPVVTATANGSARADVAVGEQVAFSVVADTPPGAGSIVGVEWDFEGGGDFPVVLKLKDTASTHVELQTMYAFSTPGTYFPAVRVSSRRDGDPNTPYARIANLGRVRIVVTAR